MLFVKKKIQGKKSSLSDFIWFYEYWSRNIIIKALKAHKIMLLYNK